MTTTPPRSPNREFNAVGCRYGNTVTGVVAGVTNRKNRAAWQHDETALPAEEGFPKESTPREGSDRNNVRPHLIAAQ